MYVHVMKHSMEIAVVVLVYKLVLGARRPQVREQLLFMLHVRTRILPVRRLAVAQHHIYQHIHVSSTSIRTPSHSIST